MKTNTFIKLLLAFTLLTFTNQVDAQGFLKKLSKAVDKGLSAVDKGLDGVDKGLNAIDKATSADTTKTKKIKWDAIPVYSFQKVYEKDSNGQPLLNEDGTQVFRVLTKDQNGNQRSVEAVKAQQKKIWEAVIAITAKVGIGAIAGGALKGDLKGAAIGAATGAVASADDIKMALAQKKSLSEQKKLIEEYENKFNEEGYPKDAKVDVAALDKDFGLTEENTLSMSTEEIKNIIKGDEYNTTNDDAGDLGF